MRQNNRGSGPASNRVEPMSERLERANVGLQISIRESGDVTIVDLRGRSTIDGESELLDNRLRKLIANGSCKLLLNLAELTQVDSSGVSVIIDTVVSLQDQACTLKLLNPRGRVLEVLRVLRLPEVISCFEDEAEALVSFRPQTNFARP
jgi:anti-sigma B factor antagonist